MVNGATMVCIQGCSCIQMFELMSDLPEAELQKAHKNFNAII